MPDIDLQEMSLESLGFDASLIDANLRLSPEARVLRHQAALDLASALAVSGGQIRGGPEPAAPATVRR